MKLLRKLGIRIVIYLDDMLIVARTQEEACQHIAIFKILIALGFIINMDNSYPEPGISSRFPQDDHLPSWVQVTCLARRMLRQQFWICQGSWGLW